MKRAAVLIGVDQAGDLPKLNDAAKGARRMESWARAQKIDPVVVLTDEGGKRLVLQQIKDAVAAIVGKGVTDQLIVYFAGHGVSLGQAERWLLTDARADTNAAVNLNGSADIAHYCGIPHVVFFSDACRTAPQGLQATGVTGGEIFIIGGPEGAVDRFWACTLGDPAAEVKYRSDPDTTTGEYKALYTGLLLDALTGKHPEIEESDGADRVVRPHPLDEFLPEGMRVLLKNMNLKTKHLQVPVARLTSKEHCTWLARHGGPQPSTPGDPVVSGPTGLRKGPMFARRPPRKEESVEGVSKSLLRAAVSGQFQNLRKGLEAVRKGMEPIAKSLVDSVERAAEPFGPGHFETQCGFKLRGARFVAAYSGGAKAALLGNDGVLVRVENVQHPGASVLLVFEGGSGAVLPAIPGFIGALSVEREALVDVAYEPSDNSWRWQEFVHRASEVRVLRAVAASSIRAGVFRLEDEDALALAQRMQYAKGLDPTLAVYAAYAYHDIRRLERIREMSRYMRDDLGARLFDIAMLAGELDDKPVSADQQVLPFLPLLSQGWALLPARRLKLPAALENFQRMLLPTVWTMFNADGVKRIGSLIQSGEVR